MLSTTINIITAFACLTLAASAPVSLTTKTWSMPYTLYATSDAYEAVDISGGPVGSPLSVRVSPTATTYYEVVNTLIVE